MKYISIVFFSSILLGCSPYHGMDAKFVDKAYKACVEFGGLKAIEIKSSISYSVTGNYALCQNGYEINLKEK